MANNARARRSAGRRKSSRTASARGDEDLQSAHEETLERYLALYNDAPIAYATVDDKGLIIQMNVAAITLLRAESGPVARPFLEYVDGTDAERFLMHLLECGRTGEATTELHLAREGRAVRLVSRRARGGTSHSDLYYTIITDVTEERRGEQALRESEARYREIVETANEGICIVNAANEIIFANRRLGAMVGLPADALVGRPACDLVPEAEAPAAARAFEQRGIGVTGQSMQRLRRVDGTSLAVAVSTTVRRDEHGRFTSLLRMYTDATAQQELTESRELLMRQLVAAQERERQRIARELHDQVGQHIVALSLGLARLADVTTPIPKSTALVRQLRGVADAIGRDMHTLAFELRPSALDHLGLAAALRGYGEEFASRTQLQIDVHCDAVDELELDATLQTGMYRIAQEALTNVVKHANAASVSVILERRGEMLQLIVEDDGVGFAVQDSPRSPETKLGLAGMRERAALLRGSLTIESSPGNGTTVYVRCPINSASQCNNEQKTSAVTG